MAPDRRSSCLRVLRLQAERTGGEHIKGKRYPITFSGAKTEWRRARARAGVEGLRFHDFRHDLGTDFLRETGNLKLVQRALNHSDIKTTTRYAHVLDKEVAEALARVQADQNYEINPEATAGRRANTRENRRGGVAGHVWRSPGVGSSDARLLAFQVRCRAFSINSAYDDLVHKRE